jgi:TfoX/Sxy family transcriptional regulator of competence genes
MATDKSTVEFIVDQLDPLPVRTRAMFGEYGLYCDEKVVAFICDDTLFLKPTEATADLTAGVELGKPYPGAKDYLVIDGDRIENRESFQGLIQATADALPKPKPKKPKKAKK